MKILRLLKQFPRVAERAKRFAVERGVPFNRMLGIKLVSVAHDSSDVVLRLPARRGNFNVAGTVHGAAILALAETVHGVAVLWQFSPAEHRMFTKHASLDFIAPAKGELTVSFCLADATRRQIEADLRASGRCEVILHSSVRDGHGRDVAALQATYVIRRYAACTRVSS